MDSASAALQRLCDPEVEVSAHYLIGGVGTCWQMVAEDQRAWHAGAGQWRGQDDINSRSIGIELDNRGDHPFAEPQMAQLEHVLAEIMTRWSIPPQNVIGHSDMAPGRKFDPGPRFDWPRLACRGLARSTPAGVPGADLPFRQLASASGYSSTASDDDLLRAVRDRFRPWGSGELCEADKSLLHALALDPPIAST